MSDKIGDGKYPELDEFLSILAEKAKAHEKSQGAQIISADRFKTLKRSLTILTDIVMKVSPDAVITYELDNGLNIGHAVIRIETDEISVTDVEQFIAAIRFADNFEIYPLTDGRLRMTIMFHGMTE